MKFGRLLLISNWNIAIAEIATTIGFYSSELERRFRNTFISTAASFRLASFCYEVVHLKNEILVQGIIFIILVFVKLAAERLF